MDESLEELAIDTRTTLFAEILLPVPIPKLFTYRVPMTLNDKISVGQRAIVQFGDRKILTGVVISMTETPPLEYEAKYLLDLLDEYPSITDVQLKLFRWISEYYMCTLGEVMNAAMPSGLKLSSESRVQIHPAFNLEESTLSFSEKEIILLKRLTNEESLEYSDISKLLEVKYLYSILKSLVNKEAIILYEEVREKFKPKSEKKVRLTDSYNNSKAIEKLFEVLSSKPKQEAILLKFLQDVPVMNDSKKNREGITKKRLIGDELSESSLNTLIKNGVFEGFEEIVSRFADEAPKDSIIQLNPEQLHAQHEMLEHFKENNTILLHGITGSGKTEIYINLIKQALDGGSQVLYLLPEIALTTQVVQRLKKVFGSTMGIYHSRFSDNERVEVWNGILAGRFKFVIGVRSSIFLPFDNLGLIIVDEEHDASYKQQEPAPRYNARDVALVLSQLHHSKVILGSATPSLESYYQTLQKKYGYVRLDKRFGDAQLPTVVLADMGLARKRKTVKGEFSQVLLVKIEETLKRKEQAIIFQNRRGYSPMVNCEDCGWVPKCINCAVSLTYHQFRHAMVCHYCGYRENMPEKCPVCSSLRLMTVGYGTEKLEEELSLYFPDHTVGRMDMDTTRSKTGYETILEQFENGHTDILVGTQMVTKGLDFDKVSLVGIFNADRMIHFPDFRSYERAFQLITQVSGRAGRRNNQGIVVIQTANPDHPLLQMILHHKMTEFYAQQLEDRKAFMYPPFSRLIEITIKHPDKKICRTVAQTLFDKLLVLKNVRIMGPGEPMISKIRNQFLFNILIKIPRGINTLAEIKRTISEHTVEVLKDKEHRNARVVIDVDPA